MYGNGFFGLIKRVLHFGMTVISLKSDWLLDKRTYNQKKPSAGSPTLMCIADTTQFSAVIL
jgi:hypothetical protein